MRKKRNQILMLFAVCLTLILGISSSAKAAVKNETLSGRVNIGGNEGYTITIQNTFSVNTVKYNTFAKVKTIRYDVSRNRRYTKRTSPITITGIKVNYGATGFTENKKRQTKSVSSTFSKRSGTITTPSSWSRVYVDDGIGITGANITVYYKEKGKNKSANAIANYDGCGVTSYGRWGKGR